MAMIATNSMGNQASVFIPDVLRKTCPGVNLYRRGRAACVEWVIQPVEMTQVGHIVGADWAV